MPRAPKPVNDYLRFVQQLAHLSRVIDVDEKRPEEWKRAAKKDAQRLIRRLTQENRTRIAPKKREKKAAKTTE